MIELVERLFDVAPLPGVNQMVILMYNGADLNNSCAHHKIEDGYQDDKVAPVLATFSCSSY